MTRTEGPARIGPLDLSDEPEDAPAVLAALAARDATERQSALPESLLAAETACDRETAETACEALVEREFIERITWEDGDERLPGYYLTDKRAKNQGLHQWRESQSLGERSL